MVGVEKVKDCEGLGAREVGGCEDGLERVVGDEGCGLCHLCGVGGVEDVVWIDPRYTSMPCTALAALHFVILTLTLASIYKAGR